MAPYQYNRAIVRKPARSVIDGLRATDRGNPTYDGIRAEHDAYCAVLQDAGVEVVVLPALEAYPDSVFVEDPALVFAEGAILLRPGTPSRIGETQEIAPALRTLFDSLAELPSPGFTDGGDVLVTAGKVMIGLSARSDRAGAVALAWALAGLGRKSEIVATPKGMLHFKTACSLLDEETILATPALAHSGVFDGFKLVTTAEGEEAAANALRVNDILMVAAGFPRTIELLDRQGYKVVPINASEIGKIDAGLSCMSLRWHDPAAATRSS